MITSILSTEYSLVMLLWTPRFFFSMRKRRDHYTFANSSSTSTSWISLLSIRSVIRVSFWIDEGVQTLCHGLSSCVLRTVFTRKWSELRRKRLFWASHLRSLTPRFRCRHETFLLSSRLDSRLLFAHLRRIHLKRQPVLRQNLLIDQHKTRKNSCKEEDVPLANFSIWFLLWFQPKPFSFQLCPKHFNFWRECVQHSKLEKKFVVKSDKEYFTKTQERPKERVREVSCS